MPVVKINFSQLPPAEFNNLVSQYGGTIVEEITYESGAQSDYPGGASRGSGKDLWPRKFGFLLDVPKITGDDFGKFLRLLAPGDPSEMTIEYAWPSKLNDPRKITLTGNDITEVSQMFDGSADISFEITINRAIVMDHAVVSDTTEDQTVLRATGNLSEITDASVARTNLELGSAAIKNVGVLPEDIPVNSDFESNFDASVVRTTLIPEAPNDGVAYTRKLKAWAPVPGGQPVMNNVTAKLEQKDNSINAVGIVAGLGLEVGDVIEISNVTLISGEFLRDPDIGGQSIVGLYYDGNDIYVALVGGYPSKQVGGTGALVALPGSSSSNWGGIIVLNGIVYLSNGNGIVYKIANGVQTALTTPINYMGGLCTDGVSLYVVDSINGNIYRVDPMSGGMTLLGGTTANAYCICYYQPDNSLYVGINGGGIYKLTNMAGGFSKLSGVNDKYYRSLKVLGNDVYAVWNTSPTVVAGIFGKLVGGVGPEIVVADIPDYMGGLELVNGAPIVASTNVPAGALGTLYKAKPFVRPQLFTVDAIIDADNIIVNSGHAGNGGPLNFIDSTVVCTVKGISKWYAATMGLGQAWTNGNYLKTLNTNYYTHPKRTTQFMVYAGLTAGSSYISLETDQIGAIPDIKNRAILLQAGDTSVVLSGVCTLPSNTKYYVNYSGVNYAHYKELR